MVERVPRVERYDRGTPSRAPWEQKTTREGGTQQGTPVGILRAAQSVSEEAFVAHVERFVDHLAEIFTASLAAGGSDEARGEIEMARRRVGDDVELGLAVGACGEPGGHAIHHRKVPVFLPAVDAVPHELSVGDSVDGALVELETWSVLVRKQVLARRATERTPHLALLELGEGVGNDVCRKSAH